MTNTDKLQLVKLATIAVDLDGTLAHHTSGEFDREVIGDPVPRMLTRVKRWLKDGEDVVIFTARASDKRNLPPIKKWLKQHGLAACKITNEKTPDIEKIYDDRAVAVHFNKGTLKQAGTYFDVTRALERDLLQGDSP